MERLTLSQAFDQRQELGLSFLDLLLLSPGKDGCIGEEEIKALRKAQSLSKYIVWLGFSLILFFCFDWDGIKDAQCLITLSILIANLTYSVYCLRKADRKYDKGE